MGAVPAPAMRQYIPAAERLSADFTTAARPAGAGAALNFAAIYALLAGDLAQAIAIANRAAVLCEAGADRRCYGNAMNQSGIALWRMNDPYAAIQRMDRGARAFVEAGDMERAAIARLNVANIRYDIGDLAGALADYEAIDRLHGSDARWDPVGMLGSMSQVLLKLGRTDDAKRAATRAMTMLQERSRSSGTRWESDVGISTMATMALIEATLGNAEEALRLHRETLAAAERSGSPLERYNATFAFAQGLMRLKQPQAAYPYIETALSLVDRTDPAGRRDTYDLASQIAAAVGRPRDALDHLRAAEAVRNEIASATLRSAIADANAQTAVAEREAQLARRDAEWAARRTRWLGWAAFTGVVTVLLGAVLVFTLRARVIEQRYAAVLAERTRMARELHDTLLQGITGITLQLRAASRGDAATLPAVLGEMADEAGRWASETRHAVWDMRAAYGDDLQAGLQQALATARGQSRADIQLDCDVAVQPGPTATGALLRVAQEALSNAARHAQAGRINVSMRTSGRRAVLTVADDGVGFQAAPELSALGGHWGLLGMRERIEALGGSFTIAAAPGKGTCVTAEVPL